MIIHTVSNHNIIVKCFLSTRTCQCLWARK